MVDGEKVRAVVDRKRSAMLIFTHHAVVGAGTLPTRAEHPVPLPHLHHLRENTHMSPSTGLQAVHLDSLATPARLRQSSLVHPFALTRYLIHYITTNAYAYTIPRPRMPALHLPLPTLYYGLSSSASVHFPPLRPSTNPVMLSRLVERRTTPKLSSRVFAVVDLLHIPRTLSNSLPCPVGSHAHGLPRSSRPSSPHTYIMQFLSLPMLDPSLCVCFDVSLW